MILMAAALPATTSSAPCLRGVSSANILVVVLASIANEPAMDLGECGMYVNWWRLHVGGDSQAGRDKGAKPLQAAQPRLRAKRAPQKNWAFWLLGSEAMRLRY
jgi:hypothetical protein